ncbi:hypothetical protein [Erwinia phyllosphaerae]|uniref:hypothetical protein n=1 Tax=Erwinia phyllosphaerae TaxID=2853256 RepID=UPI001FEEB631|nr:hypothetical protein [Erwinia phyllosphaerae]MBV4369090.1 hypothetical protein [Erwinia phyllosphaerae]
MKFNFPFFVVTTLLISLNAYAEDHALKSGVYEQLKLAVSSSGEVTGYYADSMGDNASQTCIFTLHGSRQSVGEATISAHSAQDYPGKLSGTDSGVMLTLPQGQQQPGCMNLLPPDVATGIEFTRGLETQWQTLAQAAAEKVYLHKSPAADGGKKVWIIKNDVVGIIAKKENWSQVQFVNDNGKSTIGWVETSQLKTLTAAVR